MSSIDMEDKITYEDFAKIEMRIGTIISVERIENTDKLLKLVVDAGEEEHRSVVSGIAEFFDDEQELVGKQMPFVTNLAPRKIRGVESNGMIVAVGRAAGFALLHPEKVVDPGSKLN